MALVAGKVTAKNIAISTTIWVEIFVSSSSQLKMLVFGCFSNMVGRLDLQAQELLSQINWL